MHDGIGQPDAEDHFCPGASWENTIIINECTKYYLSVILYLNKVLKATEINICLYVDLQIVR